MSDAVAEAFDSKPTPTPDEAGRSVTLTITLHPNGQIEFSLPSNKIVCYGLLECARAEMDKIGLLHEAQKAQASRGGLMDFLRSKNGGHR